MDQGSKDMVEFCLEFVRNNVNESSQNVQCRNWLKMAMDTIEKSGLDNGDFMVMNLKAADGYFSGADSRATSNTVIDNVKMVEMLLKDV